MVKLTPGLWPVCRRRTDFCTQFKAITLELRVNLRCWTRIVHLVCPSSSLRAAPCLSPPVRAGHSGALVVFAFVAVLFSGLAGCIDEPETQRAALVDTCTGIGDGALCNDQNACTTGDRCAGGLCVGSPAADGTPCTDGNQCTGSDACLAGLCLGTALPEGVTCTDGDPCTDSDTCRMGSCSGGSMHLCDDGISCTNDSCVRGIGCRFDPTPACPDGATVDGGADAVDARPDADAVSPPDVQPAEVSGPEVSDGPSPDRADLLSPDLGPDTVPDVSGPDMTAPDGPDAGMDVSGDGGQDGSDDGRRDGPDGGQDGADARDAQADVVDGGGADEAVREFEARGGACACALDGSAAARSSGLLSVLAMALAIPVVTRRRRRR